MYSDILAAIQDVEQISSLEPYLQSLQPYVRQLRQSYRSRTVTVDYSDFNIQAAYLLAYYPQYAEMTYRCVAGLTELVRNWLTTRSHLQACFFGGGPAPEVIAVACHLQHEQKIRAVSLSACVYDIADSTWAKSREITKRLVRELAPNVQLALTGHQIDLCQRNVLFSIQAKIQSSQLFVIQNCLNEFAAAPQIFVENIVLLLEWMPTNSVLVLADLNNYVVVQYLMKQVEAQVGAHTCSTVVRSCSEGNCSFRSKIQLTPLITQHLLTGENDLIPRRNINFNYLIVQKQTLAMAANLLDIPF
jgi:hypothetical protein